MLLITVVFTFAAVHTSLYIYRGAKEGLYSRPRHRDRRGDTRIEYQRFNVFHRWMHFLVIVSFTVLVFTGMPLKYKDTAWAQWFMDLFGGRHGGRRLPPPRGHRHGRLLDRRDGLHGHHGRPRAAARTCAARVP